MTSTRSGGLALTVQWGSAALLVVASVVSLRRATSEPSNPVLGVLCGYMTLMAMRDGLSVRSLKVLDARAREQGGGAEPGR